MRLRYLTGEARQQTVIANDLIHFYVVENPAAARQLMTDLRKALATASDLDDPNRFGLASAQLDQVAESLRYLMLDSPRYAQHDLARALVAVGKASLCYELANLHS